MTAEQKVDATPRRAKLRPQAINEAVKYRIDRDLSQALFQKLFAGE